MAEDQKDSLDYRMPHDADLWRGKGPWYTRWLRAVPWRRIAVITSVLAFLVLLAALVYSLLITSYRVPIIVVDTDPYEFPFPPQSWSGEDAQRIESLAKDINGHPVAIVQHASLDVIRHNNKDGSQTNDNEAILKGSKGQPLCDSLAQSLSPKIKIGDAAIIWVSMPGIAYNREPYLVPPNGLPHDKNTWLKVSALLKGIRAEFENCRNSKLRNVKLKLVVLDCCRNPTDLRLGWLENDFVKELSNWWEEGEVEGQEKGEKGKETFKDFAILSTAGIVNSGDAKTGISERSWASTSLRSSVFNYFFCNALAGAVDKDAKPSIPAKLQKLFTHPRSIADIVTLGELKKKVTKDVNQWVATNRACQQSPLLLVADDSARETSLTGDIFEGFTPALETTNGDEPVSNEDRLKLWKTLDQLRELGLYRFDPLAWRDIEQQLVWLDKLAESGVAYTQGAKEVYDKLDHQINALNKRVTDLKSDKSIVSREHLFTTSGFSDSELKLRSIALAEFLGSESPITLSAAQNHLQQFRSNPNPPQLQRTRRGLERDGANDFADAQFLKMLDRYQFKEMWSKPDRLQKVLALRMSGQDSAVPNAWDKYIGDERVHAWVRGLADIADDARRKTEDLLLVDGQPNFDSQLALAQQSVASALRAMTILQNAMRVRDRVWAELPYYVEWQTARPWAVAKKSDTTKGKEALNGEESSSGSTAFSNEQVDALFQRLANIVTLARQLDAILSQPMQNAQPAELEVAIQKTGQLSDQVDRQFSELMTNLQLSDFSPSENKFEALEARKIEAGLANPALPFELRSKISKRLQDLNQSLMNSGEKGELIAYQCVHNRHFPIDLQFDNSGSKKSETTDSNIDWQNSIYALGEVFDKVVKTELPRSDIADVDRRVRVAAPFLCDSYFGVSDIKLAQSVRDLRRDDLRELILWHAQRTLHDFWGPAGDQTPYVLTAVNDYLDSARKFTANAEANNNGKLPPDPPNIAAVRRQVKQEVANSKTWLQPRANNVVAIEPESDIKTQLNVAAGIGNLPTATGTAAVYIQRNGNRANDVSCAPTSSATLPLKSMNATAAIPGSQLRPANSDDEPRFDVTALFRGHEFHSPFKVEHFSGIVVEDSPHSYGPGRVTIRSPWRGQAIAVILDCSQSMDQLLENEHSRLNVAKESLQDLLSALSSRPNIQIGVRLFGHRVGWSTDRPVRVLTSPTFSGSIPPNLTPDRDVERILPLGPFNFTAAQMVFAALRNVEHGWGQSPLYLALQQSLVEDFRGIDADIEKHIIVITDGRNYQARPEAADQIDLAQVVQAAQKEDVPIHVLMLGSNAPDSHEAVTEFVTLSEKTGGTREEVSGTVDLRTTLQKIVRRDLDQMKDMEGKTVDQGMLGIPLSDAAQRGPNWYTVNYKNASDKIHLAGSEAIDLYARRGDTRLFAYPFDHDVAGEAWFKIADSGDSVIERVHRPFATQQNVEFHISLQRNLSDRLINHTDIWRWTPRPAEAWIEICPLRSSGKVSGPTYLFYDANFTPNQPVPLLEMVARDWPKEATHASVSAWYKTTVTEPEYLLPIAKKEQRLPDGVTLSMNVKQANGSPRSYQIQLIERHPGAILNVEWLKIVPPVTRNNQPTRVRRQYDEQHGIAIHTFTYVVTDEESLAELRRSKIGVASRSKTLSGATAVSRIAVKISSSGELLPLTKKSSDEPIAGSVSVSAR